MSTYLIIGASRGIGLGLVKQLGADPKNTIIATVRKGSKTSGIEALNYNNIKLVYVDIGDSSAEVKDAFKDLKALTPNGIDVVIHNAAIGSADSFDPLHTQDADLGEKIIRVNSSGVLKVYQAIYPRLEDNGKPVKYVIVSSLVGKLTDLPFPGGSYGASKAAANYFAKQIAAERKDKGDTVICIHPGLVATDEAAVDSFLDKVPLLTVSESASKVLSVVEKLTFEDTGKFFDYEGKDWGF